MKSNYTHISTCLDRSGSMASIKNDTINGYNHFITAQRALPGDCTASLIQFDSQGIDTVYNAVPVAGVVSLNEHTFQPRGGTPLYDAIAHTVQATGKFLKDLPEAQRPAKVVCLIITDGEENSSREFNQVRVFEMIKHQREAYKWEFVFIGANQDSFAVGQSIGIATANCLTSAANTAGTQALYSAASSNMRSYRSGSAQDMAFTKQQRQEQEDAGAH